MTNSDVQNTEDQFFKKLKRPSNLRLNCKLQLPSSNEENVDFASGTDQYSVKEITNAGLGWRHVQRFLLFVFIVGIFLTRTSISVALIAMTTQLKPGQEVFYWSHEQQGTVISSFLWGYAVTQVPAGYITTRFGAKRLIVFSLISSALITFCVPIVSQQWEWIGLSALRICLGLLQGVTFPGSYTILGKWTVPKERSSASAFVFAAQPFGIFLSMALTGMIAVTWGWKSIFYIFGTTALVIAVAWVFLAFETPEEHPYISDNERNYISQAVSKASCKPQGNTPWRSIFTSIPFLVTVMGNVGTSWTLWFAISSFPAYANAVFEFTLSVNGVISGIPFLLAALISPFVGVLSDKIIRKGWIPTLTVRKIMTGIGLWGPSILFLAVNFTPNDMKLLQIIELAIANGCTGAMYSGWTVNVIEISPRYSGLLFAISNFVGAVTSSLAPPIAGAFVDHLGDEVGWSAGFYLASAVGFVAHLIYLLFANVKQQPWNDEQDEKNGHVNTQDCDKKGIDNHSFSSVDISNPSH